MAKVKIRTYSKAKRLVNERRRQITKGALQLFLENGYHRTSVRRIAEACGMSVGSIYHYIGSKEDILYLFIGEATTKSLNTMRQLSECTEPTRALIQAIDKWNHLTDELQGEILFSYQEIRNLKPEMRAYLLENKVRVAYIKEYIRFQPQFILGAARAAETQEVDTVHKLNMLLLEQWSYVPHPSSGEGSEKNNLVASPCQLFDEMGGDKRSTGGD